MNLNVSNRQRQDEYLNSINFDDFGNKIWLKDSNDINPTAKKIIIEMGLD
jgi:hypothetical protein